MGSLLFINAITGTEMWVADERKEEYEAAGHRLVVSPSIAKEPTEEPEVAVKKVAKKKTTKK